MALASKPVWIFWSDMARRADVGRPLFRIVAGLALLVALGFAGVRLVGVAP